MRGAKIVYDVAKQQLIVNGHPARAPLREGKQRMAIFVDRTGLDVYASDGLTFVPMPFLAPPENQSLEVAVTGGTARFDVLQVHALKSAW